jgi:polo-like kinase 1
MSSNVIIEYRKDPEEGYYEHFRYIKGRLLRNGGFGEVYECNLFRTKKVYAMKILDKYKLKPHDIKNLRNEIRVHCSLEHQHVCQFKHMFEDKRYCYILLEVCDNRSMFEIVEERRMLSETETRYYMQQLIQGVKYLHENMIVHRDLKLDNIFLDRDLNVKVGDLGRADELVSDFSGTLQYMAPEILDRSGHSFQADIWAIGVVIYTRCW